MAFGHGLVLGVQEVQSVSATDAERAVGHLSAIVRPNQAIDEAGSSNANVALRLISMHIEPMWLRSMAWSMARSMCFATGWM